METVEGGALLEPGQRTIGRSFAAGALSGLVADLLVYPFDRLQTLLVLTPRSQTLRSIVVRGGGWRTLYQGVSVVLLFTLPSHGLYFGAYEAGKRLLREQRAAGVTDHAAIAGAAAVAELSASPLWTVQEVLKQRLQAQGFWEQSSGHRPSLRQVYRETVRSEGARGLFRGFVPGLMVYMPFTCVYFWMFEQGKRRHWPPAANGLAAAACATVLTHPLDVIRTHIVVHSPRRHFMRVARDIYGRAGWRGFTRGLVSSMLWLSPSAALTITAYQYLSEWLGVV